jgi:hypothetical protein
MKNSPPDGEKYPIYPDLSGETDTVRGTKYLILFNDTICLIDDCPTTIIMVRGLHIYNDKIKIF